jgi:hypothetical protein
MAPNKRLGLGLIPIALPPHLSISPKRQTLICLVIGNLSGALIYNHPARAWELGSWVTDSINGAYSALSGTSQAQTPLPIPQQQAPIGNSNSIEPCFSPPSPPAPSIAASSSRVAASPGQTVQDNLKDRKAKILMNVAMGNRIGSIYSRVHSPDSTNGNEDFYSTSDGLIRVTHDGDRVVSIGFVQ